MNYFEHDTRRYRIFGITTLRMLAFYKMITEQLKNRTWFNFHRERFNSVEIINRESEIYRVEPRGNIDNEI